MKRGERKLLRELGEAVTALASSSTYAEEYMARQRAARAEKAYGRWVVQQIARDLR